MTYAMPAKWCGKARLEVYKGADMKEVTEEFQEEEGKPWTYATVRRHVIGECSHKEKPEGDVLHPPVDVQTGSWKLD